MRELGMALTASFIIGIFFTGVVYPNLEYTGGKSNSTCIGECYEEYVKMFGTSVEQEKRKQALAAKDKFSSIKPLWTGCTACHGQNGGGGIGPQLSGQTADSIISKLITYKNNGVIGSQSALMWGQAGMLSSKDIEMLGEYIETL